MRIYSQRGFIFRSCVLSLVVLAISGCKPSSSPSALDGKSAEEIGLIQKGKVIYQSVCIACHNPNPKLDGALGPAVADASLELLESRILKAEYPAGYTPKRPTKLMVALPQYKNDIPAIYHYLQSIK